MGVTRWAGRLALGTVKQTLWALTYGLAGGLVVVVAVAVWHLNSRPDLKVWHTAELDAEFNRDSGVISFDQYLALEDRLFAQLDEEVYANIDAVDRREINRYHRGSLTDPARWNTNWNRSFVLEQADARIGVLLLHGMSDSPYSLRAIGSDLHSRGAYVLGLRVPGHGTAPSGLLEVEWQDMAAAVDLAVRHLSEQVGDAPLFIVGYSNGGALAVQYALKQIEGAGDLPPLQGLVLLSPAIAISKLAGLAVWQERLGHLIGLEKLAWNVILPEFDTYKYGSFALNAGKQSHLLSHEIRTRITRLSEQGKLVDMPPVLSFQSVVDATITAPALVSGLYEHLEGREHKLVLYDINRFSEMEPILSTDPSEWIEAMLGSADLTYTLTLLANAHEETTSVVAKRRAPSTTSPQTCALPMEWPDGVYSMSHIAPPFPADDPLYGHTDAENPPGLRLGDLALRGERGVLQVSEATLMRLRWNPFYAYQQNLIFDFVGILEDSNKICP